MNNTFLSDPKWSPHINKKIQGLSIKKDNKEIRLQNLEKDIEIYIQVDLAVVSEHHSVYFTPHTIKRHRYQMTTDMPYKTMLLRVQPENGAALKVNFSIRFDASSSTYKLRFPTPLNETEMPVPFRKADSYSYVFRDLPSRPLYFDLYVTIDEPTASQEWSGNTSHAVLVNYTVAIYSVQCMYWDRKVYEWLDKGCKVRKRFN